MDLENKVFVAVTPDLFNMHSGYGVEFLVCSAVHRRECGT